SLYGINRWCLILDADELLFYPHCDLIKLQDLCGFFDAEKSVAMHSILLDMYSNIPIDQVEYKSNQNPLKIVSWFDPDTHYKMKSRYYGGMRERVFGVVPCITKYPLFYFDKNFRVSRGMHEISEKPTQSIRGVLLHFKYMQDFHKRATEGARNGQYWNNSFEYKAYAKILKKNKHLNLWHQKSVKFLDNKQLIKLGIEETSGSFENYVHNKFSV
ncbi:glycosyltransferase family 2 protein, partial [Candidatus Parcubacteria bacterium]|nr:glycosyltransferase family 2 protein [Patescibacteria group bacterium]MCG2686583.1 glycosyltransferase family 2 protein [Candidatus Parcubacteria bacterium]